MNIKNEKVEQLADELPYLTGESKTAAILRALEERKERIARRGPSGKPRLAQALDFLENEIWPNIPRKLLGRAVTRESESAFSDMGETAFDRQLGDSGDLLPRGQS